MLNWLNIDVALEEANFIRNQPLIGNLHDKNERPVVSKHSIKYACADPECREKLEAWSRE
jgi:flagellar basal body-associated protein FliL